MESALREYERLRIPRSAAIVRDSWRVGRILQLDQPALESARDWFMGSVMARPLSMREFSKLLTYRVPALPAVNAGCD
jgi:2-polyprenyl-6-methoxyphenol hydroxylase-like FAD-dependent oxidoreductase